MPAVTLKDVLAATRSDPEAAANRYLLDPTVVPVAFSAQGYTAFRTAASNRLNVPIDDITVVGSARLGFSTNPFHPGSKFSKGSDIDVVVVSADLFDLAWDHLAEQYPCIGYPGGVRFAYDEHRATSALRGWVYPDQFPGLIPFQPTWFHGLQRLTTDVSPGRRPVKARLYRTWRHALHYYRWSLQECVRRGLAGV